MFVEFYSDETNAKTGFKMTYVERKREYIISQTGLCKYAAIFKALIMIIFYEKKDV